MRIADFRITRFQFLRDRVIGDSQVRIDQVHMAALELVAESGEVGLGFIASLFHPLPDEAEIVRIFREEAWPGLEGQRPAGLVHRLRRPRGGNRRAFALPFGEAIDQALWDLFGKELRLPLWRLLGGARPKVRAYASGLDFHLSDQDYCALFRHAASIGYRAFKIKVGHPDIEWDLHRLDLLKKEVGKDAIVMIDANEGWAPKDAARRLDIIRRAGHELLWVEDPILRDDFEGLKFLRDATPWTLINSGEYLDAAGKRRLIEAGGTDILNVHGYVSEVMRIGWVAAEHGIPLSLGNTFLELGIHLACALPEVEWLEYSFQNFDHLVEEPIEIRDGWAYAPERPGHGLVLSEAARKASNPTVLSRDALAPAPHNPRLVLAN